MFTGFAGVKRCVTVYDTVQLVTHCLAASSSTELFNQSESIKNPLNIKQHSAEMFTGFGGVKRCVTVYDTAQLVMQCLAVSSST